MSALERTIGARLAEQAAGNPHRIALAAPGRAPIAYGELALTVARIGESLRARGIGSVDRVAVVLSNGPEMAVAFLAVATAAACAPLNPAYTQEEFEFFFADLGVKALLLGSDPPPAARAAAEKRGLPVFVAEVTDGGPAGLFTLTDGVAGKPASPEAPEADDVALLLHTSGTTARPKIVPLSHRNLLASAANVRRTLALGADDRCLNVMPLFHIHGIVAALLASIDAGASVVCTPGFRPGEVRRWLGEYSPTWYTAVPTIHQAMLDAFAADGSAETSLRFVRSSSSALPPVVLEALEARFGVPVVEAYGMTEASHQMASNPIADGRRKIGSVGPAAGPEVSAMDERGRILPRGEIGELVVRGETITRGYEGNSEANAHAFVDGWFRTGDQGYLDEDGYVFLTGRLKELINRGGEKIAPREVEEALLGHASVARAVAFAAPHPRLGEDVAAAVVLRPGARASRSDLRRAVADRLAAFKVPGRVAIVPEIPTGPTGKMQRFALARLLEAELEEAAEPSRPPSTPLERELAESWLRVLGGDSIGVDDDLSTLGADSLAAVEVIERASVILGFDVPIAEFLEQPTIAGLIRLSERASSFEGSSGVVPLRRGDAGPPIFCTALHDGSLWRVGRMVRHLREKAPIYGLRLPPVDRRSPTATIEQIAGRHLADIERLQPDGPIRLVGSCFGGVVALEMANQLVERGRRVELLAMVNAFHRGWRRDTPLRSALALRARHLGVRLRFHRERLRGRTPSQMAGYLRERIDLFRAHWLAEAGRKAFDLVENGGLGRPRVLRKIAYASRAAQRRHEPRPYTGRVFMINSSAPIADIYPLPLMGWGNVLLGEVEFVDLPCEQLEFWNDDELLRRAAMLLDERLARALVAR